MDYQAIYEQFVDDRRDKEGALSASSEYREVHHITPRALGGDNHPSNLISLTPEDHIFAHLLLAKIHGGYMWTAFALMSTRFTRVMPSGKYRAMYGHARRQANQLARQQDGLKGDCNGNYNSEIRQWYNMDTGEIRKSTIHSMWSEYGGGRASWTSVANGSKQSVYGWTTLDRKGEIRGNKGKSFAFINRDGRSFTGTQKEFSEIAGVSFASASRVCRHGDVTKCGWRLVGTQDRPYNFSKSGEPNKKNSGKMIELLNDRGEKIAGKRSYVADQIGVTPRQLSSGLYSARKNGTTYKGWRELA